MRVAIVSRLACSALLATAFSSVFSLQAAAAGEYTITDIGTLVGTGDGQFDLLGNSLPAALNEDGRVVANGSATDGTNWSILFTSLDGKVKRVGKEKAISFGFDINDQGDVGGFVTGRDDAQYLHNRPVIWRDGKQVELPTLAEDKGQVQALNNNGDAAGTSTNLSTGAVHAVLWQNDEVMDLGTLGGPNSIAFDINESGAVVGFANRADDTTNYPFLWESGSMTEFALSEGMSGSAYAINDDGVVAGTVLQSSEDTFAALAVRWIGGELEFLPSLFEGGQGLALEINSAGQAVGWSARSEAGVQDAAPAFWDGESVIDLNDVIPKGSGYTLSMGAGINDAGQILASASSDSDQFFHGVVLNPVDESASRIGSTPLRLHAATLRD